MPPRRRAAYLGDLDDFSGKDKVDKQLGGREGLAVYEAAGTTFIDLAAGNVQQITMTANIEISLSGATTATACSASIYLVQDSVGGRSVTWPDSVRWPGGNLPVISTASSARDLVILETLDGGATWYGSLAGQDFR